MTALLVITAIIGYGYGWWRYAKHHARRHMRQWMAENADIATLDLPVTHSLVDDKMRQYSSDGILRGAAWPINLTRDLITHHIDHHFHRDIYAQRDRRQRAQQYRAEAEQFRVNAIEAEAMGRPDLAVSQREIADQYFRLAKELDR